ncbi:AAA family ATPase [Nocardia sp. NPDC050710]|uniref:ATP-binding protein n=1 Tax=Nocardia sp. NPDC050710 TaxID=3157220 RepID=UPI0033E2A6DE
MSEVQLCGSALPAAGGEFVGRQAELRRLERLLSAVENRLITLTGPGGIGKTTLAAEAVRRYRPSGPRAVYWVRLARLAPGSATGIVAEQMVQSVAKADVAGRPAWAGLIDTFTGDGPGAQRTLLVLDNCEHVLAGLGPLVIDLLNAVPGLTILATSREPVGWIDEHIVGVPPLPLGQALELFRRRAELTGRPVPEDPAQLAIVEQICGHVDNNPLFIRLAAARLRHRPPAIVLRELTGDGDDKRMEWSHGARVGAEERHRSVRDVIGWSYGLCTDAEQLLLDRMSVFAVGFDTEGDETRGSGVDVDAVMAICGNPPGSEQVEGLLERLVERSLVSARITATAVRYYLHESVRVFARDRLGRRGDGVDEAQLRARHRRYYRDKVVAGQALWYGPREREWLDWARASWDNILTGIETSLTEPTEAVIGLQTATLLMSLRVPYVTGSNRAVMCLIEQALEATRCLVLPPTRLRIDARTMVGWIALWQGRWTYTAQLLDECAAIWIADPALRRNWRGTARIDIGLPAPMEFTWGLELLLIHLDPRSIDVLARARRKFAVSGDLAGEQHSELFEALACSALGDAEQALSTNRRHVDRAVTSDAAWAVSWAELAWVLAQAIHGDAAEAIRTARASLERLLAAGDAWTAGWLIHFMMLAFARLLADRLAAGDSDPAECAAQARHIAHLQGGLATLHRSIGITSDKVTLAQNQAAQAIEVATSVLGAEVYAAAARKGAGLRPEFGELQRFTLGLCTVDELPGGPPDARATASRWPELSRAERDVAVLAAAGWANSAIAARRGSSVRTVDAQVASVLRKLVVATRADIIWQVPDELEARVQFESQRRPTRSGAARGVRDTEVVWELSAR